MLDLNFGKGIVRYNKFNINSDIPLSEQIMELTEDLLQVEYANQIVLDLGWYPELDPNGFFIIYVIKNYNWDTPIISENAKSFDELKYKMLKIIDMIDNNKI